MSVGNSRVLHRERGHPDRLQPLRTGRVIGNEVLERIGEKYGKTAAQVALRWLIQQEMVVAIPKPASQTHIEQNFVVLDFDLSDEDLERIFDMQGGLLSRIRTLPGL